MLMCFHPKHSALAGILLEAGGSVRAANARTATTNHPVVRRNMRPCAGYPV